MTVITPQTAAAQSPRTARLSAEDWAQAALDLVAEQGVSAVAVEPLARRLGVTKGSLEAGPDPAERLRALFLLVAREVKPHIIYSELLKALDHPAVQPVINRVSQRRLDYLVASFRQAGMGRVEAQHRARLAYAAYLGFLQLTLQLQQPRLQHDEFEAYVEHVISTLIPG